MRFAVSAQQVAARLTKLGSVLSEQDGLGEPSCRPYWTRRRKVPEASPCRMLKELIRPSEGIVIRQRQGATCGPKASKLIQRAWEPLRSRREH